MAELDRATRERLLNWAREISSCYQGRDREKVLNKASLVLFDLKQRRDLNRLSQFLGAKLASEMGKDHWDTFRNKLKEYLTQFERYFPVEDQRVEAWLYFLGWLHRLAKYHEDRLDGTGSTRGRR